MFHTVLVANRGEIAARVIRTLRALGVRSVAVYSAADVESRHVREADLAVRLGPAPARESYLAIEKLIDAARRSGAQAIHPGYGFLSENADFARACAAAGLVFIGPPPPAMQVMGDKISAKQAVAAAGVPVVPGRFTPEMTDAELAAAAAEVGYPVLVKPSAGGGGKGMRLVSDPAGLAEALVSARREALSSFGDGTLFIERFIERPRHIEVQVLADTHGSVVHLGERECSLQRRHQKIIEEAPSVLLDPPTRARIGAAAVEIARAVGYLGAGTVEFIVAAARPEEFFFLEMNTRLQVEHPVTELVTGLDLVAEQFRIAAGEPLGFTQGEVRLTGHAIEARVYAEDPAQGFLPTGGRVLLLREPDREPDAEAGVRVDSGLSVGSEVGPWYDPMLSKVIAWGPDRPTALARLQRALARTVVLGVTTNLGFVRTLLADPEVQAGRLDTQFVDRELARLTAAVNPVPDRALAVYALVKLLQLESRSGQGQGLWAQPSGWRLGEPRPVQLRVRIPSSSVVKPVTVRVIGPLSAATVWLDEGEPLAVGLRPSPDSVGELLITQDGVTTRWLHAIEADAGPDAGRERVWLSCDGDAWLLTEVPMPARGRAEVIGTGDVRSPMPGTVLAVNVAVGELVVVGQPLIVVEAMKMEYAVTASQAGRLEKVLVGVGEQVALDQLLATTREAAIREPADPASKG